MNKVLIKYGEIGLKGGNKSDFEKQLIKNIKLSAKHNSINLISIDKQKERTFCTFNATKDEIINCLSKVFGIQNFSFIEEIPKTIDDILNKSKKILEEFKQEGITKVAFKTKRVDKAFPLQSPQINSKLGEIAKSLGLQIDYKTPQKTLYIEITFKQIFIFTTKIQGLGGLPIKTSGRVLVLLSGGIDSPVASYLMLKRGLTCDFFHIHTFIQNKFALNSKIKNIIQTINNYQFKSNVYLLPYNFFEFETMNKIVPRYELIYFKHYIFCLAEKLAIKNSYDAIVTGDSIAQVASQTIENIKATSLGIQIPIFRPLLTYDKEEIIQIAKNIKTLEKSLEKYKDCCSIVSKNPMTKTKIDKFQKIIDESNFDELLEKSLQKIERFEIK